MGKVFLIQTPRRDFNITSAERYGEIVHVLGQRDSPALAPGPVLHKLRTAVEDYNPEKDFLLSAGGDPLASLMVGMLLQEAHKACCWLRWDRARDFDGRRDMSDGEYKPVRFDLQGASRGEWDDDRS